MSSKKKAALAVYVKNPESSTVKSRLAKSIGTHKATQFYQLCLDVLTEDLNSLKRVFNIYICPSQQKDIAWAKEHWPDCSILAQKESPNLGTRIEETMNTLLSEHEEVFCIGSDAPSLSVKQINECRSLLDNNKNDICLGPSRDGGFYLIGSKVKLKNLDKVRWSHEFTLTDTIKLLRSQNTAVAKGPTHYDVDNLAALEQLEVDLSFHPGQRKKLRKWILKNQKISIIIPCLNEVDRLKKLLPQLVDLEPKAKIIVVDSSKDDLSKDLCLNNEVEYIKSTRSQRAYQLNLGIQKSQSSLLIFLHADCELPQSSYSSMLHELSRSDALGGAFRYALKENDLSSQSLEKLVQLRNDLLHMPYGDQAFFVKRHALKSIGPFKDLDLMEDVEWFSRLKATGQFLLLKAPVFTSARRLKIKNQIFTGLRNLTLLSLHKIGVSSKILAKVYQPQDNCERKTS